MSCTRTNFAVRTCVDFGVLCNFSLVEKRSKDWEVDIKKITANKEGNSTPSSKQGVVSKSLRRETALQPSGSRQFIAKDNWLVLVIHSNLILIYAYTSHLNSVKRHHRPLRPGQPS